MFSRMFDKDNDGFLTVSDLRRIMTSLGDEKLSKKDLEMMVVEADNDNDGLVNCEGQTTFIYTLDFFSSICVHNSKQMQSFAQSSALLVLKCV